MSLRFVAEERTAFLREEKHEETDPTKRVTEGGMFGTVTSKVVRTVTEYFWRFDFNYRILAFRGVGRGPEDFVEIWCAAAAVQHREERRGGIEVGARQQVVQVTMSWDPACFACLLLEQVTAPPPPEHPFALIAVPVRGTWSWSPAASTARRATNPRDRRLATTWT